MHSSWLEIGNKSSVCGYTISACWTDVTELAETSSGKTAAFALPILQALLDTPQGLFALILTPTHELAFQIAEQFDALGASVGLLIAVIVGGFDMVNKLLHSPKGLTLSLPTGFSSFTGQQNANCTLLLLTDRPRSG